MPCTRGGGRTDFAEFEGDDEDSDPDYRESSADEEEEIPKSMARDRAQWVMDNTDDLEWLYAKFKEDGQSIFGRAFMQQGGITAFAHFVYRYMTPLSED